MSEERKNNRVLNIIGDVLISLVMIISVTVTVLTLSSVKSSTGMPNLFGYMAFSVQSDSMEPVFKKGDLLIIKEYKGQEIKVNDIVSFRSIQDQQMIINTHRIVDVSKFDESTTVYSTKGDNTIGWDASNITVNDIVGIYQTDSSSGIKLSGVGAVLDFLKSQNGFLFCIIIPLALLFLYQLYKFIKVFIDTKKESAAAELSALSEEEKQKVVEEYLRQQKEKEEADLAQQEQSSEADETEHQDSAEETKDEN